MVSRKYIYLKEAKFLKNQFKFHLMTFFEATRCKFQVFTFTKNNSVTPPLYATF